MPDALISLLLFVLAVLLVAVALNVYQRPLRHAQDGTGKVDTGRFRPGDLVFALMLLAWFVTNAVLGFGMETREVGSSDILVGSILFLVLLCAIFAFLALRGACGVFGFDRVTFSKALGLGLLYLLAAYPLVGGAMILSHALAGPEAEGQEIVKFFLGVDNDLTRLGIIFVAVAFAPFAEELIFRGYLYGVLKKYAGFWGALVFTSLVFAAIHLHLPSFGVLFVLAVCLTLAYESTGSILVPMTMHALFNGFSVAYLILGFPGA